MEERLFFELLQIAIGTRQSLSFAPSANLWSELFALSKKHALVAIAFHGLSILKNGSSGADNFGASLGIDEMTYLKWLGLTAKVAQRNKQLNEECAKVCQEFAHDGLRSVVLKGQSSLVYYPEELRECRTAGDIDLWCKMETPSVPLHRGENHPDGVSVGQVSPLSRGVRGVRGVIEYCKQYERCQGREIPWHRVLYYHCEVTSPSGIGIEPHYRPTYLNSPLRNWRLQRWFRENEPWGVCDAKIDGHIFPILPISTNVVYQLLHIYKHLFEEGIGLRQLLDYYFVLRALHIEQETLSGSPLKGERPDHWQSMAQWAEGMGVAVKSNVEIMHTLSGFGMKKFASAVMYVLQTVFAMPDEYLICKPNEKEGKFLLDEIMLAGNFGKYDERIKRETPSIPRPLWLPCIGEKRARGKKVPRQLWHAWEKLKHNMRLVRHYPEEVLWEPGFRIYHWLWRKLELWRY